MTITTVAIIAPAPMEPPAIPPFCAGDNLVPPVKASRSAEDWGELAEGVSDTPVISATPPEACGSIALKLAGRGRVLSSGVGRENARVEGLGDKDEGAKAELALGGGEGASEVVGFADINKDNGEGDLGGARDKETRFGGSEGRAPKVDPKADERGVGVGVGFSGDGEGSDWGDVVIRVCEEDTRGRSREGCARAEDPPDDEKDGCTGNDTKCVDATGGIEETRREVAGMTEGEGDGTEIEGNCDDDRTMEVGMDG